MRGIIEILVSFLYSDGSQEVWQMKQKDYHIYLDEQERWQIIQSLIDLKNALIAQGRYTDAVLRAAQFPRLRSNDKNHNQQPPFKSAGL